MSGVIWLIDAAYVLKAHEGRIDYKSLRRDLQEWAIPDSNREIPATGIFDRMIVYNSYTPKNPSDKFTEIMKSNGFEMKMYHLTFMNVTCHECGKCGEQMVHKGVGVGIVTDLLSLAYEGKYKRVVITCGDGDFVYTIKKVQSMFREVYIAGYQKSMSYDLIHTADEIYYIQ